MFTTMYCSSLRERERALCNDQITDLSKVLMHRMKGRGKRGGGGERERVGLEQLEGGR
jgi:hypothetical protein